ncbi:hypothetical protein DB347_13805 [Opitutaceae bacterium EW11]|nr:hypothetical protein DB347_13805 [Opitutaceae bacterium EW11]
MPRPRLLVVTRHSPLPENDGAGAYLFDLLSYLAANGITIEVAWVHAEGAFVRRGWWRVPRRIARVYRLKIIGSLAVGPFRFFWWGSYKARVLSSVKALLIHTGLWRGVDHTASGAVAGTTPRTVYKITQPEPGPEWSALPTAAEARYFREERDHFKPDALLANYCWMTPLLEGESGLNKLVLTHDVASHRLNLTPHSAAKVDHELSPATAEGERALLDRADTILAISEDDAAAFRAMLPNKPVVVAPKAAAMLSAKGPAVRGRCLFVGGINGPNRQGIEWFLERVWPIVHASRPDATLHICGGICELLPSAPISGVSFRGRVPDLNSEYRDAEVVVVPLLQGTGVKIKLVEACSHGKACVTTPVGLQGLAFLRDAVLETIVPEEFAQSVLRILDDPSLRHELSARTQARVSENLSPEKCFGAVLESLTRCNRQRGA